MARLFRKDGVGLRKNCLVVDDMYKELKRQLISGILSSPIIYIPHFHYELIDEVLSDIINPKSGRNVLGLHERDICEFDMNLGVVDFITKTPLDSLDNITWEGLRDFLLEGELFELEDKKIFLIKSADKLFDDKSTQAMLQLFTQKYERGCYDSLITIILISSIPITELPTGLDRIVTIIEPKAPDEEEIIDYLKTQDIKISKYYEGTKDEERIRKDFVRTLQGLHMYEMKQIVCSVIKCTKTVSDQTIALALEEKKQIVRKSGIVEVIDPDVTLKDVGGLEKLKKDLELKKMIFQHLNRAEECKIQLPKGILIIGMPGCGKTMIAKSIASLFGVSLLRLDINRLMGKYVGESEHNLRKALETAEAAHPCVLWIDEIEKAFAGSNGGSSDGDSLVVRLMGHFLTWMQERKKAVYVVATANDAMRSEFMRKGRFDEVYFVDFPNEEERIDILTKKLNEYSNVSKFDFSDMKKDGQFSLTVLKEISEKMKAKDNKDGGFSGAEINAMVNAVMEKKFVEYMQNEIQMKESAPKTVIVKKQDFLYEIEAMQNSVLCNQKPQNQEQNSKLSQIERIRELHKTYGFPSASK